MKRHESIYIILKDDIQSIKSFPIDLLKLICEFEKNLAIYVQSRCGDHDNTQLIIHKLNLNNINKLTIENEHLNWELVEKRQNSYYSQNHEIVSNSNTICFLYVSSYNQNPNSYTQNPNVNKMEICVYKSDKIVNTISIQHSSIFHRSSYYLDTNLDLYMIGGTDEKANTNQVSILKLNNYTNTNNDICIHNLPPMIHPGVNLVQLSLIVYCM